MSKIKFLGASGTVTGSCYVLKPENGKGILVDMGMFQGADEVEDLNYLPLEFDPRDLAGAILTHAHLDHVGRLPLLVQNGFTGSIFLTEATRILSELTLLDSAKIAQESEDHLPLYNEADVFRTISKMEIVEYDQEFQVGSFKVILRNAGHILGSATVEIYDPTTKRRIIFSGDLGNTPEDIVKPTQMINKADVVVMESTYGDRSHSDENPDLVLTEEINAVEESGGTLLIPAFSLERVQEILHKIDHLKANHFIKDETVVYLDSPMAIKATNVYKHFKDLYSNELARHAKKDDPFNFPGLRFIELASQSRHIHETSGTKVIIAGSGMMSGGRILSHAKFYLPESTTRLLIVGFQAEETLGRQILDGARVVTIDGTEVKINATVRKSSAMSAHADQPKLLKWLAKIKGVQQVFLTHGENMARNTLSGIIEDRLHIKNVIKPDINEEYDISN